jgi:hypothetical protein
MRLGECPHKWGNWESFLLVKVLFRVSRSRPPCSLEVTASRSVPRGDPKSFDWWQVPERKLSKLLSCWIVVVLMMQIDLKMRTSLKSER